MESPSEQLGVQPALSKHATEPFLGLLLFLYYKPS
jgi:hypothetical protein